MNRYSTQIIAKLEILKKTKPFASLGKPTRDLDS